MSENLEAPPAPSIPQDPVSIFADYSCITAGLLLVLIGAAWTLKVLFLVFTLAQAPQGLAEPMATMCRIVGAETLTVTVGADRLALGNLVALLALICLYSFCARIPLAILAAGRELLGRIFADRAKQRELQRDLLDFVTAMNRMQGPRR